MTWFGCFTPEKGEVLYDNRNFRKLWEKEREETV